jgi:Protein of unknown function (DUF2795)
MSFKSGSKSTSKNDDIIITETGKRIKRGPTSLHIDLGLWQEVRIMAVLKGLSVTDYVEDALRRKIDADNLEVGKQGYQVGQGGTYIPPPPGTSQQHKYSYSEASGEKQLKQSAFKEEFNLDLPGVKFPVSKTKIIEAARRGHNSKPIINALNRIPDKVYKDGKDLEVPLIQTYKELFAATRGISDVNVEQKQKSK